MTGLFILSLDTEIAWGTYGTKNLSRLSGCFNTYRDYFPRLIALLDQYAIPATWAVVGHLFLDRCDGHADISQPHYAWMPAPDSYRDPCTDIERAPWYYGPDIIEQIRAARMQHEIGTHTFTHVIAADPAVSGAMWDAQLRKCAELHAQHGLPMESLVYPRDKVAYVDHLSKHGIIAFRGNERRWYQSLPRFWKRLGHITDRALAFTPPTYDLSRLRVTDHLVDLPSSQFLMNYDGVRRLIPDGARVRQARRGIERAVRRGELFHLWFHPFNLGVNPRMFKALEQILKIVAQRREAGEMQVMTMGQAAHWILDSNLESQPETQPVIA